jgi:hypothetical protein
MDEDISVEESIAQEMRELGFDDVDAELVKKVHEHHKATPLKHNAALASNILTAYQNRGIEI